MIEQRGEARNRSGCRDVVLFLGSSYPLLESRLAHRFIASSGKLAPDRFAMLAYCGNRPKYDGLAVEDLGRGGDTDRPAGRGDVGAAKLRVVGEFTDRIVAAESNVCLPQGVGHAFRIEAR
jgi:hypothetical protein